MFVGKAQKPYVRLIAENMAYNDDKTFTTRQRSYWYRVGTITVSREQMKETKKQDKNNLGQIIIN